MVFRTVFWGIVFKICFGDVFRLDVKHIQQNLVVSKLGFIGFIDFWRQIKATPGKNMSSMGLDKGLLLIPKKSLSLNGDVPLLATHSSKCAVGSPFWMFVKCPSGGPAAGAPGVCHWAVGVTSAIWPKSL